MNMKDAKAGILKLWDVWAENPDAAEVPKMREFYDWVEKNHPNLLTWKVGPGIDRWQDVRGWLNSRTKYGG